MELALGRYAWASPWVRAVAVRATDSSTSGGLATLARAATDSETLVAETARHSLAAAGGGEGGRKPARYPTIDKVIVLRKVGLFHAIPHQILARVALLLTERAFAAGEQIIGKGDLGDCVYVIESGRVKVHDGERILGHLGQHQAFGELSLLDAEPRSASVSAVEPTHVFRLAQADFSALMSDRPDIMQAINRALCQMVRSANASRS